MAKINRDTKDEAISNVETAAMEAIKASIPFPMMICGVTRKVNIGDYENIDIFNAIAVPIMSFPHEDLEAFKQAAVEASELGFTITSGETGKRYATIKEVQGR